MEKLNLISRIPIQVFLEILLEMKESEQKWQILIKF